MASKNGALVEYLFRNILSDKDTGSCILILFIISINLCLVDDVKYFIKYTNYCQFNEFHSEVNKINI